LAERQIPEELGAMDDPKEHKSSFTERAKAVISSVQEDDRFKQASDAAKEAAKQAQEASKSFSQKVTQEDSWEELRGDIEELTEIARAHHALILDLVDRVEALEARAGIAGGAGHGR
jgi:DNA repair ATPase RecN